MGRPQHLAVGAGRSALSFYPLNDFQGQCDAEDSPARAMAAPRYKPPAREVVHTTRAGGAPRLYRPGWPCVLCAGARASSRCGKLKGYAACSGSCWVGAPPNRLNHGAGTPIECHLRRRSTRSYATKPSTTFSDWRSGTVGSSAARSLKLFDIAASAPRSWIRVEASATRSVCRRRCHFSVRAQGALQRPGLRKRSHPLQLPGGSCRWRRQPEAAAGCRTGRPGNLPALDRAEHIRAVRSRLHCGRRRGKSLGHARGRRESSIPSRPA